MKIKDILRSAVDKVVAFDYKKLIPKGKIERYPYMAGGIEMTWPWRKEEKGFVAGEGLGLGIGLGKHDLWIGWPREIT